ncbi:MAG: MFS transporter [Clostridiales bacterium]|jgi:OPA family glycerol-3-phosphate transporter-like MFS transporter|nr:MFS transporter [Clostridiales bacterium]
MSFGKARSRKTVVFCGLCCLIYFSSYVTRINYAAAIAQIVISLGITKTSASMAVTGSFITYGIGQIISGIIGDHIKPRTMIFLGLLITSVCNLIMFTLSNVYFMTAIWCINGFAQSMLWPPLTRIMSENLSPDKYKKTCVVVSASASVATIVIYLIVPLCIKFSGWRAVFLLTAIWGFAVGFLWLFMVNRLTSASHIINEGTTTEPIFTPMNFRTLLLHSGLIPIMMIILLQGILRDGITTWMPSYINDTYHFGTSISILSTAILPVFSVICVVVASYVHKLAKSEVKASASIWVLSLFCSSVLIVVFSSHVVVSILIMAIITGCMHGINLMLISVLPARFKNTGHIATVSGILNAFTYAGSAISSYGIAALSDNFGWKTTIITWCIIALCGTIINIICSVSGIVHKQY